MGNSGSSAGGGAPSAAAAGECPIPESVRTKAVFNVYNQRIDNSECPASPLDALKGSDILDPKNNMPLEANQQPCPGQRKPLTVDRVASNIPKGGTAGTWVYPSPQMFYNALKRKGKGGDVTEDDMEGVVHAHNTMNEITWQEVARWELLHPECTDPRLNRFLGRPDDLSPLARVWTWFGGPMPFDRHDWYVDRAGDEVRYVIDFYFDEEKAGRQDAFTIVTRPALDSVGAVMDRAKMQIYTTFAAYGLPCPVNGIQTGKFAPHDPASGGGEPAKA